MKAIAPLKIIVRMQVRGDLESSAPAFSESHLTFILTTILKGVLWSSKVSGTFIVDTLYMYTNQSIRKLIPYKSTNQRKYTEQVN